MISLLEEQRGVHEMGGTMRLGSYPCRLVPGTKAHQAYGVDEVRERHRHRYEFNNAFQEPLARVGLVASGLSPDGSLVEICELQGHPFMVGTQFHPEFRSRPDRPHPLFREFMAAAKERALAGGVFASPTCGRRATLPPPPLPAILSANESVLLFRRRFK